MNLRYLTATINNFSAGPYGNCFQRAVALVMDVPTAKLVVGTCEDRQDKHLYLHCWVENRGIYLDPSKFEEHGNQIKPIQKDAFVAVLGARDIHVIDRKWVIDFARSGNLKDWILKRDDTYHTLGGVMGEVLMERRGIPYRVDEHGALLPLPLAQN
jgi:hypothetical protein